MAKFGPHKALPPLKIECMSRLLHRQISGFGLSIQTLEPTDWKPLTKWSRIDGLAVSRPALAQWIMIVAVSPESDEARELIRELDIEIGTRYPGQPINGIDAANFESAGGYFVIAKEAGQAVGCGAFRPVGDRCAEIKRMYVKASARRRGFARQILQHLEGEIRRRRFQSIVLETGYGQPEALALYESQGYFPIPAFLGYVGSPISRCYAKKA
jgi:GNAT superfamily N-acetyltransferase